MAQETSEELRKRYVCSARRIVVKVGTNVLTSAGMALDEERVASVAEQIARLVGDGREVALVSSGAIGAGMAELGIRERPRTLPELQASASVGQGRLVSRYEACFHKYGLHAGQVLLTREDFDSRERYLNAGNTVRALFDLGCVPVVNENDTISTDEIRFGDNDLLAAHVTHLIRAELLVLLTSVPGLYAREPYPAAVRSVHESLVSADGSYAVADVVEKVDGEVAQLAYAGTAPGGTGGMESKIEAARMATEAGEAAIIADGTEDGMILRIMAGDKAGTLFLPARKRLRSRKRWLRFSRPRGAVLVDDGARRALCEKGRSLLPIGVTAVEGEFAPGDVVRVVDSSGRECARGLSNYSSDEVDRIKGLRTDQIVETLGHKYYDEVVHRDNLALLT